MEDSNKTLLDVIRSLVEMVSQRNGFGLPFLMVRRREYYLGEVNKVLTRDEVDLAYKDHVQFLDLVGEDTVVRLNCLLEEQYKSVLLRNDEEVSSQIDEEKDIYSEIVDKVSAKVYLIRAGNEYKIGFSSNPENRINGVKPPSNGKKELLLTITCNNPRALERFLHDVFSHKRISGEWFLLSDLDVEWIRQQMPYFDERFHEKDRSILGFGY